MKNFKDFLNEEENPCWKGYKQLGMKDKNGKEVPNCIPEDTEYQKFFNTALDKFKVSSPDELEGDKKKEFFDYVDKNWKAEDES